MSWIILALAASFLFGATNFIDRFLVEKRIQDPFFASIIGGVATTMAGMVIFVVRGFPPLSLRDGAILLASGFASEIALVPWYKAIKIDDASRVASYFQLIPVVVLGLSYALLGERLSSDQLIGFVLIVAGGLSLAFERPSRNLFRIRRSFWYVLISILLWAPVAVLFKVVAVEHGFWDTIAYEALGVGLGMIALWAYARTDIVQGLRTIQPGTWGVVGMNESAYIMARVLQFYAVLIGPTALVAVVGGIQPLFALFIGLAMSKWFPEIIKEDVRRETVVFKLVAIAVIFAGVVFINR